MDKCIDSRGQKYLAGVFNEIAKAMGCQTPTEAIAKFRQMIEKMDLKNPVAENRAEELEILATSVNPVRLKNNPVELNIGDTRFIYNDLIR